MLFRFLPTMLLLCGLALFCVAGFAYFVPGDGPGATIDEPDREFPACAVGQRLEVTFRIHNPTGHTVRIVGLAEC